MFGFGKHYLPDDFFRGACDVHCHLLPGVDDGFPSTEKSLYALKKLEEWGVKKMLLTPHFMKDYPDNNRANIIKEFEAFKAEAAEACNIELRLAAEYMLDARFMDHFEQGFLTLDQGGNHVLCETSYMMYEPGITEMIYEIMCADYQPVVAHPERYEYANKDNYFRWKDKRYKFQLNLLSLGGAYGSAAVAKANYLLKEGLYDYVGSDMHNLSNYERFLPEIRLDKKNMAALEQLLENNKKLFG
jgi:tyrosine-protein phosphatase YwqE